MCEPLHDGKVVVRVVLEGHANTVEASSALRSVLPELGVTTQHAVRVSVLTCVVARAPRGTITADVLAAAVAALKTPTITTTTAKTRNGP